MSLTELKYYTSKGCLSVYMSVFYQNEFYTPLHYRLANVKKLITMNTTSLIKEIIIMPKSQITGPQCHLSNVDELILSNMSKNSLKIQPIPPFLHRICSKDNLTHMKSNSTTYSYDYLKKTLENGLSQKQNLKLLLIYALHMLYQARQKTYLQLKTLQK